MKTFYKSLFRGIKSNLGRFISIIAIVILGIGFLIGLLSSTPDLQYSVSKYYEDTNLSDLNIKSTIGFESSSVNLLKTKYNEIKEIVGVTQYDREMIYKDENISARAYYLDLNNEQSVNKLTLVKGTYPSSKYECVIESPDTYLLDIPLDKTIEYNDETYTVKGVVSSSYYFQKQKETATVGSGKLSSVMYFNTSFYDEEMPITDIYIELNKKQGINYFSKQYDELIDEFVVKIKTEEEEITNARITSLKQEIYEKSYKEVYDVIFEEYKKNISKAFDDQIAEIGINLRNQLISYGYTGDALEQAYNQQLDQILETNGLKGQALSDKIDAQLENKKNEIEEESISETNKIVNKEIDKLEISVYFLDTKSYNASYINFKMNSEKVADVAVVFPFFFFLIAGLITLTSITRMVEEERVSIGTLKALGYSRNLILLKYLLYALLACGIGCLIGVGVGIYSLPYLIYYMYNSIFALPDFIMRLDPFYISLSVLVMIVSVLLVTYLVCRSTMREKPSTLILGKAPKPGKKILLERMPFLWKRLKFKYKSMFKNIFRYKKNLFVMLIGIGGCTSLLLIGFGIKDSIDIVSNYQYNTIFKYELVVNVDKENDSIFSSIEGIDQFSKLHVESDVKCSLNNNKISSYIYAFDNESKVDSYIQLEDLKGNILEYSSSDIYITNQIAEYLKISEGDEFTIAIDGKEHKIEAQHIVRNYVNNYIFLSVNKLNELTNKTYGINSYIVNADISTQDKQDRIVSLILNNEDVKSVEAVSETRSFFDFLIKNINYIVLLLIGFSGALSIVVTYNLTNININERIREIATLKVLGYQKEEVAGYVYRETMVLTILGSSLGLLVGYYLHKFVMSIIQNEGMLFGNSIAPLSYFYSFGISIILAIIVDILFLPKLKKIQMVESLKCVD